MKFDAVTLALIALGVYALTRPRVSVEIGETEVVPGPEEPNMVNTYGRFRYDKDGRIVL